MRATVLGEMPATNWTVVVPVKGGPAAKSRFGGQPADRAALALAMALDTVEVALTVAAVIVVAPTALAAAFEELGATVVDDPGEGLIAAIEAGLAATNKHSGSAVLLGDVPAVRPDELRQVLTIATDRVMVADADGTGTVLIAAPAGVPHEVRFGAGSRNAHLAAGYRELLEPLPGLRRDVDVAENLVGLQTGPRTSRLRS